MDHFLRKSGYMDLRSFIETLNSCVHDIGISMMFRDLISLEKVLVPDLVDGISFNGSISHFQMSFNVQTCYFIIHWFKCTSGALYIASCMESLYTSIRTKDPLN
uniref:Uncharacterized protein n=1 Tax=Lepeophtheirus salmonis TaxID=72036 RepID=A0A0K2TKM5_LEPSM